MPAQHTLKQTNPIRKIWGITDLLTTVLKNKNQKEYTL